jgi:branched-chain amino acid transport system substrate-binding protein
MFTRHKNIRIAVRQAMLIGACLASLPAAAQECEVKLGIVGPMTGGGAGWGLAEKAGTEFEAAWTNANGGLQIGNRKCKVTVFSFDAQSTAAGGAAASNYFASQGVHLVVGPIPSPETTGFKPVAKRHGQINFATSFSVDAIGPDFPLAFHKVLTPPTWGPILIKAARDRFNFKSVVVMGPNDQGGTDAGKALSKLYSEVGAKATEEWYQRGTTNFAPIVTRIMNMKPEAVELGPMPPGEAAILVKQLLEAGYNGAFGRLGTGADLIVKSAGGVEKQKAFYWLEAVPTEDPGIRKMNADFERLMKAQVPDNSLVYSAQLAAEQMLRAVSLAGTDQDVEKIAAELRKMTPESRYLGKGGWRGKTQYRSNQQLVFPVGMGIISDGKREPQRRLEMPSE